MVSRDGNIFCILYFIMVFANIFNIKFLHGYFIFFFFWEGWGYFFYIIIANILHIVCFCRMFAKNLDIDF